MISIKNKVDCCGCASCVQTCPQKCISFIEDREGFRYPKVNRKDCSECGLCEKVCPIIHGKNTPSREPIAVLAAKNKDEHIRMESSSGGIFTPLAENVINIGGVVFGARFDDNWEVVHGYTETIEGLAAFRGSKYVQSRIEDNYQKAKGFLKEGRKVLFTGTPCQIAGLRSYLKKDYDNLLCVDFVCHGVPSPKAWRNYLKEVTRPSNSNSIFQKHSFEDTVHISGINFREKTHGWKKFSFSMFLYKSKVTGERSFSSHSSIFYNNPYMSVFLNNAILRPSCYDCQFHCGRSGSDITIGDFWGIERIDQTFDDDKGVSLVIINSEKGKESFCFKEDIIVEGHSYQDAYRYNSSLVSSSESHPLRSLFFFFLPFCSIETLSRICTKYKQSLLYRVYRKFLTVFMNGKD